MMRQIDGTSHNFNNSIYGGILNLRVGKIENLVGRRRGSSEMLPVPKPDAEVLTYLREKYRTRLVHIESDINDRARLEHSHWANSGDWHVADHMYYVDDDTGKVYIVVTMMGD